jgi:hypothetical protein
MAGLVPAIHDLVLDDLKTWMRGSKPAHDSRETGAAKSLRFRDRGGSNG